MMCTCRPADTGWRCSSGATMMCSVAAQPALGKPAFQEQLHHAA